MGELINLVKVRQDNLGRINPVDNSHCPMFQNTGNRDCCTNSENDCIGVDEKSLLHKIKNDTYMLGCNYFRNMNGKD